MWESLMRVDGVPFSADGCTPFPDAPGGAGDALFDAAAEVFAGELHVALGPDFDAGLFFVREFADDFCGGAEDERAGREFFVSGDEGAGADDAAIADDCAVEDHCIHADEDFVADGACVEDGFVADGDELADFHAEIVREMDDGAVLNIGARADADAVDIGTEDALIPHAGFVAEGDVADECGVIRNECGGCERRDFFEEVVNT